FGMTFFAFALNWDVLSHWLEFQKYNVAAVSKAGWGQRQWAYFSEIMGWVDIYRQVVGNVPSHVNHVPKALDALSLLAGVLFGLPAICSFVRRRAAGGLALVPLLMILGAYGYFRCYRQVHNYSYMKVYTMVLPALTVGSLGSLLLVRRLRGWAAAGMSA